VFIDTTDKTIKTVMNTEPFIRISRITLNRQSVLIQSVLWVHGPDTGLKHSTSQIRFTCSTLYSSSA